MERRGRRPAPNKAVVGRFCEAASGGGQTPTHTCPPWRRVGRHRLDCPNFELQPHRRLAVDTVSQLGIMGEIFEGIVS